MIEFQDTIFGGLKIAISNPLIDERGSFTRFFCSIELNEIIGVRTIVQMNHSITKSVGAVRGMHFQKEPHAEMKLIRCVKGEVWDVAVDIRSKSPTFLQWHAETLTPDNNKMMIIPEGFAHGFQVLSPNSELLYLHTNSYQAQSEGGLNPNDKALNIDWPLDISELSERDEKHPHITPKFKGL